MRLRSCFVIRFPPKLWSRLDSREITSEHPPPSTLPQLSPLRSLVVGGNISTQTHWSMRLDEPLLALPVPVLSDSKHIRRRVIVRRSRLSVGEALSQGLVRIAPSCSVVVVFLDDCFVHSLGHGALRSSPLRLSSALLLRDDACELMHLIGTEPQNKFE